MSARMSATKGSGFPYLVLERLDDKALDSHFNNSVVGATANTGPNQTTLWSQG